MVGDTLWNDDLWFHGHDLGNNNCITTGMGSIGEGLSNEYWSLCCGFFEVMIIVTIKDKCDNKLI